MKDIYNLQFVIEENAILFSNYKLQIANYKYPSSFILHPSSLLPTPHHFIFIEFAIKGPAVDPEDFSGANMIVPCLF
jgi:hypothetical protein